MAAATLPPPTQAAAKRRDVHTRLNYLYQDPNGGSPPILYGHPSLGKNTQTFDMRDVTIRDISGEEDRYTLDEHGFQLVQHVAREKDFVDEEVIKSAYYDEVRDLVMKVTGASHVHVFDHNVRRPPLPTQDPQTRTDRPAHRVHLDQSLSVGPSVIRRELPAQADRFLLSRCQIINVWRPIHIPIAHDPLAVCDAQSVPEEDLVSVPIMYPNRVGEVALVRYGEGHRWFFKRGLTPEQVYFFKCYDSKTDGRSRRSPHTAFVDPSVPEDAPPRQSIEVRALVFHEDDKT